MVNLTMQCFYGYAFSLVVLYFSCNSDILKKTDNNTYIILISIFAFSPFSLENLGKDTSSRNEYKEC